MSSTPDHEVHTHVAQEARTSVSSEDPVACHLEHILRLQNHSNINTIFRILSRCRRWCTSTARHHSTHADDTFSVAEWAAARRALFFLIQQQRFKDEIVCCSNKRPLKWNSPLKRWNPFMDKNGLLRVGGRLSYVPLPYGDMHSILLHSILLPLVLRLTEFAHFVTLHGGPQVMASYLNRFCRVIGGTRLRQYVYHKCVLISVLISQILSFCACQKAGERKLRKATLLSSCAWL